MPIPPPPHPSGTRPPVLPARLTPKHIAIVMDGNGRWANARGLPRTEGHRKGEASLVDVVAGAIEAGVPHLSVYAFSTENWKRSPEEVAFLMRFNREVIHRQRDLMNEWGVRMRWSGRSPKLWSSVIKELEIAEEMTQDNNVLTLTMCVNYGGRAEIADAAERLVRDVRRGKIRSGQVTEKVFASYLNEPDMPDVDMFWRTGGESRLSNFLLWQSAYAEIIVTDTQWPDVDRLALWDAMRIYAGRDRRWGGAVDQPGQGKTAPDKVANTAD